MSEKTAENTKPPVFDIFLIFRYLVPVAMETKIIFPELTQFLTMLMYLNIIKNFLSKSLTVRGQDILAFTWSFS